MHACLGVGSIAAIASLAMSVYDSMVSSRYDEVREFRELQISVQALRDGLEETRTLFGGGTYSQDIPLKLRGLLECTMHTAGELDQDCQLFLQKFEAGENFGFDRRCDIRTHVSALQEYQEGDGSYVVVDKVAELVKNWNNPACGPEPMFRTLQRWIVETIERSFPGTSKWLPATSTSPSPTALLVAWITLAIAVAVHHETRPGHKYRKAFLFGSLLLAALVGFVEHSSISTIILTDIPWCMSLALATSSLAHIAMGRLWVISEQDIRHRDCERYDVEKASG